MESVYLNHKGYDTSLLTEQYLDMAKNFLTGTGVDALLQYFKEYAAKWILSYFKIKTDSWLATIFITAVGNLPIGDITKLTNCNYVVPYFTKSLVEAIISKFLASKKLDNPITATIRNALVEVIEDTSFVQKLQESLSGTICPMWSGLGNKMEKVGKKLVQNNESSPSNPSPSNSPVFMTDIN